jgi:hypothetical protein
LCVGEDADGLKLKVPRVFDGEALSIQSEEVVFVEVVLWRVSRDESMKSM